MDRQTHTSTWEPCTGCRRPVDAHLGLRLRSQSWICSSCAHDVAKDLRRRTEPSSPSGSMRPTFN